MQEAFDTTDVRVKDWETIPPAERVSLLEKLAQVQRTFVAIWIAAASIACVGVGAVGVLVASFFWHRPEPQWATSAVAAIITAAVAMIFGGSNARRKR